MQKLEEENYNINKTKAKKDQEPQIQDNNFAKNQQIFKQLNFDFDGVADDKENNNNSIADNNVLSLENIEISDQTKPQPNKRSKHFLEVSPKQPKTLSANDLNTALSYLKPSSKQELSKIITNISTFQTKKNPKPVKNPQKYTHISSFDSKEKAFGEDIGDFKRKVLINPIHSEWKKRLSFINKRYFSGLSNEEIEFHNAINTITVTHTEFLENNYKQRKDYLFQDVQLIPIEEIFTNDKMLPHDHPLNPLGKVESLETFIEQYSLQHNIKSMDKALSMFSYWRNCLNDGNSFYRVVMFSLLQSLIVQCKVEDLKKIACEINLDKYKDLFDLNLIDSNIVMSIFKGIINSLEQNNDKGNPENDNESKDKKD